MSQVISDGEEPKADRRQFLLGGAAVTAAAVAADTASADPSTLAASASVVLHDTRIPMDPAIARRLAANGARLIALDEDPVRMWRGEAGALLGDPATRLLGVTRWADLLIVRGLAAESRRHLRFEQLDRTTGTFIWLIA